MSIFQLLLIVLLYFDWNIRQSFDALMEEGCCHCCGGGWWCRWCWCWRCYRICDHSCFLIACLICVSLNGLAYWNSLMASFLQFYVSVRYSIFQELHRHTDTHSFTHWTEPYRTEPNGIVSFLPLCIYTVANLFMCLLLLCVVCCVCVCVLRVCICVYPCVSVYNNLSCRFSIFNTILQLGQQHQSQRSK